MLSTRARRRAALVLVALLVRAARSSAPPACASLDSAPTIKQASPIRSGSSLVYNLLLGAFPGVTVKKCHHHNFSRGKGGGGRSSPLVVTVRHPLNSLISSLLRKNLTLTAERLRAEVRPGPSPSEAAKNEARYSAFFCLRSLGPRGRLAKTNLASTSSGPVMIRISPRRKLGVTAARSRRDPRVFRFRGRHGRPAR